MSISIYKLSVDGYKATYIGSTRRDPHIRFLEHARSGNRCASRVLFKLGLPVKMEIITTCSVPERDEIEKYHILNTPHTINRTLPGDYSFMEFKSTLNPKPPAELRELPSSLTPPRSPLAPSPPSPCLSPPSPPSPELPSPLCQIS